MTKLWSHWIGDIMNRNKDYKDVTGNERLGFYSNLSGNSEGTLLLILSSDHKSLTENDNN